MDLKVSTDISLMGIEVVEYNQMALEVLEAEVISHLVVEALLSK